MKNFNTRSIIALLTGIILPWTIVYLYNLFSISGFRFTLQYIASPIVLGSAVYVFMTNIFYIKASKVKWLYGLFFVLISLVFFFYSVFLLYLQFVLGRGFGF